MEGYLEWLESKRKAEENLKRYKERCAAEDAKWHKYNTQFNREQMEDWCEGESPW